MQGNQVFRHAVVNISEAVDGRRPRRPASTLAEVDWFIPHQANQRILEGVADRLGIDEARVISTVAEHANTSAASIPLALAPGDRRRAHQARPARAHGGHGRRPDLGRVRCVPCF